MLTEQNMERPCSSHRSLLTSYGHCHRWSASILSAMAATWQLALQGSLHSTTTH